MVTIKRKMYRRGSSTETTIPKPLLFALDTEKKHNILFKFDPEKERWYIEFEEAGEKEAKKNREKGKKKSSKKRKSKREEKVN